MDPSSICGIKDIVLNEKVSCPLSEPVHCHIVRVSISENNESDYFVHGILSDNEYLITATFSKNSIEELGRSPTNLQRQLEGTYIDLQDYMIYPSVEKEQKRCTFILCIEKFETARESMVDEINDDLPMISMNEKVKQRLRYLWRLNQLRKEWSIKLGNEFPTKGPRIVQYKVYISEEDKKKLAELKRLQESSRSTKLPHQKKSPDRHKNNDNKDQNSQVKFPSLEESFQKVVSLSQGRLPFESNADVRSNVITTKEIASKGGESNGQSDDIVQKSPKSGIRDILAETNEGTSNDSAQCSTRKHHIENDVNEISSGKKVMLNVFSESTSNNNIHESDHIDASQGFPISEVACRVLRSRTNQSSTLETGAPNLNTTHTASSVGDSASFNKESALGQDIPMERGISKDEVMNYSKETCEGQETSTGVRQEKTIHNVNKNSSESVAPKDSPLPISSPPPHDEQSFDRGIAYHSSPVRLRDESQVNSNSEEKVPVAVKQTPFKITSRVVRKIKYNDCLIDKESEEFVTKRKGKKDKKRMSKMESNSAANSHRQQMMVESDEEMTKNNVELIMESNISPKNISEDSLARQNTQHRNDNKTQQIERNLKSEWPNKGVLQTIFNNWADENFIPETPDIKQSLKLFERFHECKRK